MSKPKFSLYKSIEEKRCGGHGCIRINCPYNVFAEEDYGCILDRGGQCIIIMESIAEFMGKPQLTEQIRRIVADELDDTESYAVINIPVLQKLYAISKEIWETGQQMTNGNYELYPSALHFVTEENDYLFDIIEGESGEKTYNFFNNLSRVEVLEYYFRKALELNKAVEYGKYN